MMKLVFVVPDPPPDRDTPGRAADQHSPNAEPLAVAGRAVVATDPAAFPLTWEDITVVFGKTMLESDGYEPVDPVIEVLEDVGVLIDPDAYSHSVSRQPNSPFFTVSIEAKS